MPSLDWPGFFFSEEEAGYSIPFECPPTEILSAYGFGEPRSLTGVEIISILPKLHEHLRDCTNPQANCREYVLWCMETKSGPLA
ncbi:hypothetical protein A3C91_00770 [Candidatus Azambacteria bacterium RIFCSPHIGHO2_02_FULL_52_12]|uniref:Uncharacterized protein n=1 Tax=Candidatus Azambacteria bacterium RIFCSPLOWO2_01_FULL_46_25 TaxID=1797298 RepID=A0A1F5BTW1_9BACT|nr:MAG: hypothetical protein A3C91_00770 [Candidatus Azambacteria bacterium RIFCSPHIGHO2_02_FULL_52_12]OGD34057.1 MAG: hypothetical protein A2988_01050 [Candidatus Azambacteria bacterium RIFCSPLOWO2_01_FULL_46_25]OGD37808.1 MAG: hypothetical protein A2850_04390 [Candidatus Azambacteria bacterium RIFCSPHIGHO2_01_FULL_51_74]